MSECPLALGCPLGLRPPLAILRNKAPKTQPAIGSGQSDRITLLRVRVAVVGKTKGDQAPWKVDGDSSRRLDRGSLSALP
jgi:hypothetical protein